MAYHRRNRTASAWSLSFVVVVLVLLPASVARGAAAGPAPQYDPRSAAGKEYILPLARARQQAQPSPGRPAGPATGDTVAAGDSTAGTALFGEGITPATRPRDRASAASSPSADGAARRSARAPSARDAASSPVSAPGHVPSTRSSSGMSGALVGLISGGAVLLLAALLTVLARRRVSSPPATEARG